MAGRISMPADRRTPGAKNTETHTRYSTWIRALSIFISVMLVGCVGAIVYIYTLYKDISGNPFSVFENGETGETHVDTDDNIYAQKEKVVNILLLGIDSDAEREEQRMGWRSDVMIVCSINFATNEMSMISIPRDTYTTVNKLDQSNGSIKTRVQDRINTAYSYGGGPNKYGADNAMDAIKELLSCGGQFNIPIDYYASVDMEGLPKLIDAVGGVDVVLDRTVEGVGKKGEAVTITSKNVGYYVRVRHGTGGGDNGRAARQMELIIQMMKKIQKMGAVSAATKLYDETAKYLKTNMTLEEVLAVASFAQNFSIDSIVSYRAPSEGKMVGGKSVEILDADSLYKFVLEHFYTPEEQ